jgi:Helix-turn-helix domain
VKRRWIDQATDAETGETITRRAGAGAQAATLIRRHHCASQYDSRKKMIMTLQAGDKLMSVADVSEMLGIPLHTLYRWRYMGHGPVGYRVGRHVRYD